MLHEHSNLKRFDSEGGSYDATKKDNGAYRRQSLRANAAVMAAASAAAAADRKRASAQGSPKGRAKAPAAGLPLFCEVSEPQTQELVCAHSALRKFCTFVVSHRLSAKLLANVAEDPAVAVVYTELLCGAVDLCVRPSSLYAAPSERVSFHVLQTRAQRANHVSSRRPTISPLPALQAFIFIALKQRKQKKCFVL